MKKINSSTVITLLLSVSCLQNAPKAGDPFLIHLEGTVTTVPIPATIWLIGSGLIGLISLTRHKV